MSDTTPESSTTPPESVRLNGWKDIAAYLDRGVRTVQRWEKEFDLPVRRLGPGEGVFALRHEVDKWQSTPVANRARTVNPRSADDNAAVAVMDTEGGTPVRPGDNGSGEANGIGEALHPWTPVTASTPEMHRLRRTLVALLVVVVGLAVWVGWSTWHVMSNRAAPSPSEPAQGVPASLQVDLDTLRVLDASGRELWHFQFSSRLAMSEFGRYAVQPGSRMGIEDIDGDGRREVWIVVLPDSPSEMADRRLLVFGPTGQLRWKYQFSGEVRFGGTSYGPIFPMHRLFTTADPNGSTGRALWAVSTDPELFPSVLQRLDPKTGKALSTYWSNGYIEAVALGIVQGRSALLVGANFNDARWKSGSLAVLDPLKPEGSAPAETGAYRCMSCGSAEPLMFLVFPKPKRFGHPDMAGPVFWIGQAADGDFTIKSEHAEVTGGIRADAMYHLDSQLRPKSVALADNYDLVCKTLVRDGNAPAGHPEHVDPIREFLPIYQWNPATRAFVPVPMSPDTK